MKQWGFVHVPGNHLNATGRAELLIGYPFSFGSAPLPPPPLRNIYRVDQSGLGGDIYSGGQTGSGKQFRGAAGSGKVYRA